MMLKKRYKRKKGPVRSKKVTFDGINFASGLEKHMYYKIRLILKLIRLKDRVMAKVIW